LFALSQWRVLFDIAFLYPLGMDYGQFKGLQALLFFGLPIVWGVWQLIALRRSEKAELRDSDS